MEELLADISTDNRPLTPEILTAAGWEEVKIKQSKCREFDFYEEYDDGRIDCFEIKFNEAINRIFIEYSNEQTSIRIVKPNSITVGEFNTLLDIVKLEKFKIK